MSSALVALPLLGCSTMGELGQIGFALSLADMALEFESGDRILDGSRVCPEIDEVNNNDGSRRWVSSESAAVRACYVEELTGPAELDAEQCLAFSGSGEVLWSLEPSGECEWPGDRLRFSVVEPGPDLRLGFDDWRARMPPNHADDVTVVGLAPGRSLADLREDPSAPRLVAAGQLDVPMLRLDDADGRVFWTEPEVTLTHVGDGLAVVEPIDDPDAGFYEFRGIGEYPLTLEVGAVATIQAALPNGAVLESPELIAVSATTAAASLDLVVLVDLQSGAPTVAFAELRDAEGRVIHGAPVEWSVLEGVLPVTPADLGEPGRTAEYASLDGLCKRLLSIEVERRAVLHARFGVLEDSVELLWTQGPSLGEPDPNSPFTPDEACLFGEPSDGETDGDTGDSGDELGGDALSGGCGCTTQERGSPAALLLALAGVGLLRRRNRMTDRDK